MTSASVSILIPAYNAQKWIDAAIRSALAQTWATTEVIVVDDGSTDRTLAFAQRFAAHGVRVATQTNQGAAAARNHAYSLSRGDYIQWLDADDLLAPDKIARQMEVAVKTTDKRALFSAPWGEFIHRPTSATFRRSALWHDLTPADWLVAKLQHNLYMANSTWLVSRELTEAAGPWDSTLSLDDDGEYFSRVVAASSSVRFVEGARSYYRRAAGGSLSDISRTRTKLDSQFRALELQVTYVRSLEESERVRRACVDFLQRWSFYFYPDRLDLFAKAGALAKALGSELRTPQLSWKYAWLQKMFGWSVAKKTQMYYNRVKWSLVRSFDKTLFWLEGCNHPRESEVAGVDRLPAKPRRA